MHEVAASKGLRLYYPELSFEEASRTIDGCSSIPEVDVPVLAIVGTSSQQGKFSLQLAFRRRLLEIIFALEQEFGIEVDDEELRVDLFDSVNSMVRYVSGKWRAAKLGFVI